MSNITLDAPAVLPAAAEPALRKSIPFLAQVRMMSVRYIVTGLRQPASIFIGLFISAFFLFVYEATLGKASAFLPGLQGKSYLGFILPLSVLSAALGGAGIAGQAIVRDIESGYFDKLLLTPINRFALVLGALVSGAFVLGLQTSVTILVGLLMGLDSATGVVGLLALLGFSLLIGLALAGFTVGIALQTGSAASTESASFLFFPLSFLTASFVPLDLLSGWIKTAATFNPVTYILEAMRGLLLEKNVAPEIITRGLFSCIVIFAVTFAFAMWSLRARTRRK